MNRRELLFLAGLPVLQNKTYPERAEALACPTGDIALVQDVSSGLVFNAAFDPQRLSYDADYQNEQACSTAFRSHLDDVTAVVDRFFDGRRLVEVGCGKGFFFDHLKGRGYRITGVDPAYEGNDPDVIKACFEPGLGIAADGVILRHVLEHVPDPVEFLAGIARANGGQGQVYVEVPCFDWIRRHRAWYDVYYEHVNYFCRADFFRMFATVREAGYLFGGQYLYVVADLASLRRPRGEDEPCAFPADFLRGIERHAADAGAARISTPTAIWGAASKGVIFALHMQRAGAPVRYAIDINPAKQGRFLPVTGIEVLAPARAVSSLDAGTNVYVMNPNYLAEISAQSQGRFHFLGVDNNEL